MRAVSQHVRKATYEEIKPLRNLYLKEQNCQIRYDSCHWRGWSDHYLFLLDENPVGYGAVKGLEELKDRDTIFELFVLQPFRKSLTSFLEQLISVSNARFMESQTNDDLTTRCVYEKCRNIRSDVYLFEDEFVPNLHIPGSIFRKRLAEDLVFGKKEAVDEYVLEIAGEIMAAGGFLLHYNEPFADLYMEVDKNHRGKGYASYILQEIKKACYLAGRYPAARCNVSNVASKASLLRSGFKIVGHMIKGTIK